MRWCRIWLGHAAFHHRSGVSCPCESLDSLVLRYDSIRWVNYARWSISGAGMLDKWGRLMCICRVASACRECIRWHLSKLEDIWIASADKLLGAPRRPSKYLNSSCFGQRAQLTYRIAHHIYTFKTCKVQHVACAPNFLGLRCVICMDLTDVRVIPIWSEARTPHDFLWFTQLFSQAIGSIWPVGLINSLRNTCISFHFDHMSVMNQGSPIASLWLVSIINTLELSYWSSLNVLYTYNDNLSK